MNSYKVAVLCLLLSAAGTISGEARECAELFNSTTAEFTQTSSVNVVVDLSGKIRNLVNSTLYLSSTQDNVTEWRFSHSIHRAIRKGILAREGGAFEMASDLVEISETALFHENSPPIKDPVTQWAARAVIQIGVKQILQTENLKIQAQKYTTKVLIKKILSHKITTFLLNPLNLFLRKDREVPKEILAMIVMDGIEPHRLELMEAWRLARQDEVQNYRIFSRVYSYVAKAVFIAVAVLIFNHKKHEGEQMRSVQVKESINQQLDGLDQALDKILQNLQNGTLNLP